MYSPRTRGGEGWGTSNCLGLALGSTGSHILSMASSHKSKQPHSPEGLAALVVKLESGGELLN